MNLQNIYHLLIPIILILLNVSCSSNDIIYDYDHTQLFSNYSTYRWGNVNEKNPNNLLSDDNVIVEKIKFSANKILREKGLKELDSEKADFIFLIYVGEQQQVNDSHQTAIWYHPWWQPCGYSSVSSIEKGSLVIDVIDKDNNLIWRGLAPEFFKSASSFENNKKELNEVVSLLFENFPPD